MGEMADLSIEHGMDDMDHYEAFKDADPATQYEEGIIDECGHRIGNPSFTFIPAEMGPHGEGKCPKCDGPTVKREGRYGTFYGCAGYPKCNGSRGE